MLARRLPVHSFAQCAQVNRSWRDAARQALKARQSDLSMGVETVPIRCENASGGGPPFPSIEEYISRCRGATTRDRARLREALLVGCDCATACCAGYCACLASSGRSAGSPPYDADGRLLSLLTDDDGVRTAAPHWPIVECSEACSCSQNACRNSVVGRGVQAPLTVFYTTDGQRGWGVRADSPLARGMFVCEYAGELVSAAELSARRARRARVGRLAGGAICGREARTGGGFYEMSIVEHRHSSRGEGALQTNIDPTDCGNVGRFLNHSCEPNLVPVIVRVGSVVPSVGFFCLRDVAAGEELTFDCRLPAPCPSLPRLACYAHRHRGTFNSARNRHG